MNRVIVDLESIKRNKNTINDPPESGVFNGQQSGNKILTTHGNESFSPSPLFYPLNLKE